VDNNLASSVVVDLLEFTNVTVLHHHTQKLHDDLGAWSDQHLSLVSLFGVGHGFEGIGEG